MKLSIKVGATSQTVNIFIRDSSSLTGGGLTGLVYNSPTITAYYALPRAAAVSITLATLAAVTSAYSSGGFKEIDPTNMPGWYRFDIPDAALASGRFVSLHLKGVTNMAPTPIEIELTGWDNQNATTGGLANLDAAITSRASQTSLDTLDDYVDTEVAAIKAKTDNLPSDPADASDIASSFSTVNSTLTTIASYIDTEVGLIKAKTDNLPADTATVLSGLALASSLTSVGSDVTLVKAKTDSLTFTVAGQVDANITYVNEIAVTGNGETGTEWGPA